MISPDGETVRAIALCDVAIDVLPGLLQSLTDIRHRVDSILARQGVTRETWSTMDHEQREDLIRKDRKTSKKKNRKASKGRAASAD